MSCMTVECVRDGQSLVFPSFCTRKLSMCTGRAWLGRKTSQLVRNVNKWRCWCLLDLGTAVVIYLSFLSFDRRIVDSFHRPRLPFLQPLSVLILEGTSLRMHTRMNVDVFSTLRTLSSDNRRPYGKPVLNELQASPGTEMVRTFCFLNYLLRSN